MSHMIYRLQAAIALGWIDATSSRARVAASVGGNRDELDFCMAWLKHNA
jgi:hypothetical protein